MASVVQELQQGIHRGSSAAQALHICTELLSGGFVGGLGQQLHNGGFQAFSGDGILVQEGGAQAQLLNLPGGDGLFLHLGMAIMGTP